MDSPLRLVTLDANIGVTPQKRHQTLHALGGRLITLFFKNQLIVRLHTGFPLPDPFPNHVIHRKMLPSGLQVHPLSGASNTPCKVLT